MQIEDVINLKNASLEDLITFVKKQQDKLAELTAVINNLPGSVYWKDKDGRYLGRNQYAQNKMKEDGFVWKACEGLTDYDLFSKEVADGFRQNDLHVMQEDEEIHAEESVRFDENKILMNYSIKRPLRRNGEIIGVIGTTIDISNLKKIEHELGLAKQKAESLNQAKEEFLQNLEHDMRTPITTIIMVVNTLIQQVNNEQDSYYLQSILTCAECILNYFNELLDYSSLKDETVLNKLKPFSIMKCLDNVILTHQVDALNNDNIVEKHLHSDLPEYFKSDELAFFRIVSNLLGNAIKFTKSGTISITMSLEKFNQEEHVLLIVKDTGIGISETEHGNIFNSFYRVTPANQEIYKGKGLGLSIVKKLIAALQGSLLVNSKPQCGSTFTCRIPMRSVKVAVCKKTILTKDIANSFSHINSVLLVEDNLICQTLSKDLLASIGLQTTVAKNGVEAFHLANQQEYDLLLMDIGLPDTDGIALLQKIKQESKYNRDANVIMLTAHSKQPSMGKESSTDSTSKFMPKPLTLEKLAAVLVD